MRRVSYLPFYPRVPHDRISQRHPDRSQGPRRARLDGNMVLCKHKVRLFRALFTKIEVSKFWLITIDHFPSTKFHAPRSSVPRLLIFLSPDIRSLSGARECRRSFLHTIARTRVQGHSRAPTHSSSSRSPAPQACIAVHSSQGSLFSSLAYTLMARCP